MSKIREQDFQETNALLQVVFDSAPNGIAVMQTIYDNGGKPEDFAILLFNAYTLKWIGSTDYKGKRYSDVFPMVKETGILEKFIEVAETGIAGKFERWYAGEGMKHWFRFTAVKQGELLVVTTEDITERKRAEEALTAALQTMQQQQRLYDSVTNNTPDLVYVFDLAYRFTYANKALLTMWGKTSAEAIGRGLRENGYEEWHAQMHEREIDEVVATKKPIRGTVSFPHAELGSRIYDYIFAPVLNEKGEVEAIAGSTRDISDIKSAEEALRKSEEFNRTTLESSPDCVKVLDTEGRLTFMNYNGTCIMEIDDFTTLKNKQWWDLWPDDSKEDVMSAVAKALKGETAQFQAFCPTAKGTSKWWDVVVSPIVSADGAVSQLISVSRDITEKRKTEEAVKQSESRFRTLVEEAPMAACLFTGRELTIALANNLMLQSWGKTSVVIGKTLHEAMPELDGQPFFDVLDHVFTTGESYHNAEAPAHVEVNGEMITYYFNYILKALRNEGGEVYAIINTNTNVTEQVLARQKIEESEARFRSLIEEAPVATCLFIGRTQTIAFANDLMLRLWGKTGNVIGTQLADALPELKGQPFLAILDEVFTTGKPYAASAARAKLEVDGVLSTYYFNFTYKPLFNKDGEVYGIIDMAVDVTEQVLAQQKTEESEANLQQRVRERTVELEALNKELQRSNHHLEEFAHAASHDLKEPIRKIHFFTSQLKSQLRTRMIESEASSLNRIENATERMGSLIDDLLLYSHVSQRPHEKETVDLREKIQRVQEDLELDMQEKGAIIEVKTLPNVAGYPRQLQQLFQNLISNAVKYSKVNVPPHIIIKSTQVEKKGHTYNLIDVSDNGIGFEQEYGEKIFQMFARLHGKGEYKGTGVGLSIVKKIVENHNGMIEVMSQKGIGSTFKIYLPLN